MTRLLAVLAIALFVAYLASQGLARLRGHLEQLLGGPEGAGRRQPSRRGGQLVACDACGVHVPVERAFAIRHRADGEAFHCAACHANVERRRSA